MLRLRDIQRRFDRAAAGFDGADFVHALTREGLVSRLGPLVIEATTILDLGSATGAMGRLLKKRFKRAHIVALDLSHAMLREARKNKRWLSHCSFVQADARHLPFADASLDLVVANQLLPWIPDPGSVFGEVARVLTKRGVFTFATLGPDSLRQIDEAWSRVDDGHHVNRFPDMHDIGDGLVRAGLREPVLDVDRLQVSYASVDQLFADLSRAGARNTGENRTRSLTGRGKFSAMTGALAAAGSGGKIMLDLELVYGHCWCAGPKSDAQNLRFDVDQISRRNRNF